MWFPGIPLSILNGFIFITLFLILKKYLKKSKAQEKTYFIGWGLILILSLLIDLKSYDYTNDQKKMAEDFPYYDNLEWWDKVYYGRCILSFSYYGKGVCQKIFNEIPSLNNPTNENLNARLKKCHVKNPEWKPTTYEEVGHIEICENALKELGSSDDYDRQLNFFDTVTSIAQKLQKCSDRHSYVRKNLIHLKLIEKENLMWEKKECIKNKCYEACWSLPQVKSSFPSLEPLKDEYALYSKQKYYANDFILNLMVSILIRKKEKHLDKITFRNVGFDYIYAYYKNDRLDFLINSAKKIITKEIPEESKEFDFEILRDVDEIKKQAKLERLK